MARRVGLALSDHYDVPLSGIKLRHLINQLKEYSHSINVFAFYIHAANFHVLQELD